MSLTNQPPPPLPGTIGTALTKKKNTMLVPLLAGLCAMLAVAAGVYGYLESRRTERIVIAVKSLRFGQQVTADDLGTIEVPLYRPQQLAGMTSPAAIIGHYAAREIGVNDIVQSTMLMPDPPDQPTYPNGEHLTANMIPLPFSTGTIGPLTFRDRVNLGFTDPSGDPALCDQARAATAGATPTRLEAAQGSQLRPYACRFLSDLRVLYVDGGVAYLELTPYQAQTVWAIQAAGLALWGERYGASSDPLPPLERLDIGQVNLDALTRPVAPTPENLPETIPGSTAIPGSRPLPGGNQE